MSRRGSTDMRRKAWARFQDLPMPSVRDEEWMRTDIRLFKLDRFELPEPAADASAVASRLAARAVGCRRRFGRPRGQR